MIVAIYDSCRETIIKSYSSESSQRQPNIDQHTPSQYQMKSIETLFKDAF